VLGLGEKAYYDSCPSSIRMPGYITQVKVADNEKGIGLGIAEIGSNVMQEQQLSSGEFIQVLGKRKTVVKCDERREERQDLIRIDGVIRNNAGVFLDDHVTIRKVGSVTAKKVILSPLQPIPPNESEENYCLYLADALRGIPMVKCDLVAVPYFGGKLFFQVVGIDFIESDVNDIAFIPDAATKFVMEVSAISKDKDIVAIGQKANLIMDYLVSAFGMEMRFSILYAGLVDHGEFELKPRDIWPNDFQGAFSRYRLLAEHIIREFNSRIGQENIPKDQSAAMLAEIKSAIMDKWSASLVGFSPSP
jgi:hypothetical protein